ncbi:DUF1772 domain-containing protein [Glutamicibacter sp. MNS18]|uniref:anthrone oxygenase family protein n=1 Tax=Glutamicibacter sp. MNS18 TaxID=2989817 RepID=UPI00223683BC|nr:anthrone oxygenase family protein [Glutamicibacter sp. MNS18]MCW4464921.1 DUF1772 domain-containing protein [Glutamicibacter sp. MNS18]
MDSTWQLPLVLAAMLGNALLAGTFYAFTCAIRPGFRSLGDLEYVLVFRRINAAILNPGFLLVFLLTPLGSLACTLLLYRSWQESWLLVAAAALSLASFLITVIVNVPLNKLLATRSIDAPWQQRRARRQFEAPWNRWNALRMLASCGAVLFFTAGLLHTV